MSKRSKTPIIQSSDMGLLNKSFSATALQRKFNNPRPLREYRRFFKGRISSSGLDQNGGYSEFINRDLIKPYHDRSLYQLNSFAKRDKWALDTTKKCSDQSMLPKVQQFKDHSFSKRDSNSIKNYQSSFLGTDNISIRVPQINDGIKKNVFLTKKFQYGSHSESIQNNEIDDNQGKTLFNKSSVVYNIISQEINQNDVNNNLLDQRINFKKARMGAFCDQTKVYCTNVNKDYQIKLEKDDHLFHNYKGIFSNMYDIAHKNGNLIVPFRKGTKST